MSMSVKDVEYTRYHSGGNIDTWIAEACRAAGLPHKDAWLRGYKTLCEREVIESPVKNREEGSLGGLAAPAFSVGDELSGGPCALPRRCNRQTRHAPRRSAFCG
jgi:hypothetical protein